MTQSVRKTSTEGLDFYPTQPWATRALVEMVRPQGLVWEPACGGGHMSEVLLETNPVVSTDVVDYGYERQTAVLDFFQSRPLNADWIITNPPFSKGAAERFAVKAIGDAKNVALLLRLSWLEGVGRVTRIFMERPPSRVIVLPERLGFHRGKCEVGRSGMLPYAWYVWEEDRFGGSTFLEWASSDASKRLTKPDDADKFNGPVVKT